MTATKSVLPHEKVKRFSWIVVNVSDLERSRMFYETFTPLRSCGAIAAEASDILGVTNGSLVGCVLRDECSEPRCSVLLVQWLNPSPTGSTYESHANPGYFRMCFQHPDAAILYEQVIEGGYEPLSPLRLPQPGRSVGRPVFCVCDPDGTVLEFLTMPGEPRLYHVNCNTRDLERAHQFFECTVGLECAVRSTNAELQKHSFGHGDEFHSYDARLYRAHDDGDVAPRLLLDVVESTYPESTGHSYTSPVNVGIVRVGLEVDDVDEAYRRLVSAGAESIEQAPQQWDLGPGVGSRSVLVLKTPDAGPFDLVSPPK